MTSEAMEVNYFGFTKCLILIHELILNQKLRKIVDSNMEYDPKMHFIHGMLLALWNDELLRRLQLLNSWTESMIFGKIGNFSLNLSNYRDNLMIKNNSITRPSHRFQGLNYSIRV